MPSRFVSVLLIPATLSTWLAPLSVEARTSAPPAEAEAAPALTPAVAGELEVEGQFDRMTEEDLLRGLEGLVPPAEVEDEAE